MNKSEAKMKKQQMGITEKILKLSETDMAFVKERVEQAVLEEQLAESEEQKEADSDRFTKK